MSRGLRQNRINEFFPESGPFARDKYRKHMQFFEAGRSFQERCFLAANRVGKTIVGAYECTLHLTGLYPHWWRGARFDHPVEMWAAGDTSETTRDIVQAALMGPAGDMGTGMIAGSKIMGEPSKRSGVVGAMDTVVVQHVSGRESLLGFKSYDQGRKKFQGTAKHLIWDDEEPPSDVYDEEMMRLMTTNGLMICTFTPLMGLTDVTLRYLPDLAPKG